MTIDSAVKVAGRNAYDLVLDPNDGASLIKQVRIAVDGETKVPLQVVVYGRDNQVVFKVGYTDVSFARPDDSEFVFNAPPGTTVTEAAPESPAPSATESQQAQRQGRPGQSRHEGRGQRLDQGRGHQGAERHPTGPAEGLHGQAAGRSPAPGATGRLLAGTAFSALLTDDGRLAVGAVSPDALYAALG